MVDRHQVLHGDCLEMIEGVPADSVQLIYLDPPFFTQRNHRLSTRDGSREFSFSDLWTGQAEYGGFLLDRLRALRRALAQNGAIFVHCDRNSTHIVRAVMDAVFGEKNFRSEIIWYYRRWSNGKRALLPAHQTILYYTRSNQYTFNLMYEEYSASTNIDQILQRRTRDSRGKSCYDVDNNGVPKLGPEKRGVPLRDVWDIPYLNPKARERVGYPTQKPLLLLERIIKLASNEGDLVLDPFCGSGTTCVAASLLNRRSIGIDVSAEAVSTTTARLAAPVRTDSALLRKGRDSYFNIEDSVLSELSGLDVVPVQRNKGIDALLVEQFDGTPVPLRVQRRSESFLDAVNALAHAARSKNAKKMVLIRTVPAIGEEAAPDGMVILDSKALRLAALLEDGAVTEPLGAPVVTTLPSSWG
jgi:site-specific DNA-methyltransferase (adenine-specific)